MRRAHPLPLSVLCLILLAPLGAVEIELSFDGEVFSTDLPGVSRGQPLTGRLVYETTTPASGADAVSTTYPALLLFEARFGTAEYFMSGAPGDVILFSLDPDPNALSFQAAPGSLVGPALGDLAPAGLALGLLPVSPSLAPTLDLAVTATEYGLADLARDPTSPDVGLRFFDPARGDLWVLGRLSRLDAARRLPPPGPPGYFIRLEDIVAGGDGSGNAPAANTGIDPRTGAFTTGYFEGRIFETDGVNPQPVPASPYIDSVFLMKGKVPTSGDGCNGCFIQYTTQSGVQLWVSDAEETGSGWNYILKNRSGGVSTPGIRVAGPSYFTTSIGLHASEGVTFDLDALRARHGADAVQCFSGFWGMDDCSIGQVRLFAMVSNDAQGVTDIRNEVFGPGQGNPVSIPIPPSARYLTLASASVDGNDNCDHATIARPAIGPTDCLPFADALIYSILPSRVAPGGEDVTIEGESLREHYSIRVGGIDLLNQTYVGDQRRTGRTPQLSPGVYDVEVVWLGILIQRFPGAVEVEPPPVVTAVHPDKALADRRTFARFIGQHLRPDMQLFVVPSLDGPEDVLHQTFYSPEIITGSIPPPRAIGGLSGTEVFILDQGRLREFPISLLYVEVGLEGIWPPLVATPGGTPILVTGAGFQPGMSLRLGGAPVLGLELLDSGHARGISPPLPEGLHAAELFQPGGELFHVLADAVQALPAATPTILNVVPPVISTRGGDLLTISTDTWNGGLTPRLGGVPLTNVDGSDPLRIRGEAPRLPAGVHDVELVGADGGIVSRLQDAVQVYDPTVTTITSVTPLEVATGGGTPVTLRGTGFEQGLKPRLGGLPLTDVQVINDGVLQGLSPPLEEGPHDASLTEGNVERARLADALTALPISLPGPVSVGGLPTARFTAGSDRIAVDTVGIPGGAVLRVGGAEVLPLGTTSPCGWVGGGGGGGLAGGDGHAVFEGKVPPLPPGLYTVDIYMPGQGVLATLEEAIEVTGDGAPPQASQVVSEDVLPDGSTRLHIFGSGFGPQTAFLLGGRPISDAVIASSTLAIGHAPALGPGEPTGPRDLQTNDPRGSSVLKGAVVYVSPEGATFVRGDPNQSGMVDLSDAVAILGYLFLGNPSHLDCLDAADMDAGGVINIADAIQLLGHLFLGGPAPQAPYPACGLPAAPGALGCERFPRCGGGGGKGGGAVGGLRANVFVLPETRTTPGEPIIRDLSPVSGEIVVDDPPGGLDLEPGDIIAGYVPPTSAAIRDGVTYLVKLDGEGPTSCLATGPADRTFRASSASLAEVFDAAAVELQMPPSAVSTRLSKDLVAATGNTLCDLAEGAGGAVSLEGDRGAGGAFAPLIDVELPPFQVFGWNDGPNYVYAGFHRLRVLYANDEASLGVGISGLGVTGVSFFSGILLDTQMVVYVDAHYEEHLRKETKVLSLRKDHIVVVYGVPIHFAATGELFAGVELDAEATLNVTAGAQAHFKAGVGVRYDGSRVENLSGLEPPTAAEIPNTTEAKLSGSIAVKGYVRPVTHLFAGILFRGLTADIGTHGEAFARFHAQGRTSPDPCFDWGVDVGMSLAVNPEIQLFGKDLYDQTIGVIDEKVPNLIGGRYGCKEPPVPRVTYTIAALGGERYEVRLDASASYDPDDGPGTGPLRFRWDFDADGQCDLATLGDPRATVTLEHACLPYQVNPFDICVRGRAMRLRVTDDENVFRDLDFTVVLR